MPRTAAPPPRYREIAARFAAEVAGGARRVGDLLPTEIEICRTFGVSRHTAREALRLLERDGLVARRQGSGTRVVRPAAPLAQRRPVRTIDDLLQYGNATRLVIDRRRRQRAGAQAAALGVAPADTVLHLSGLRYARGRRAPLGATEVRVPLVVAPADGALLDADRAVPALVALLDPGRLLRVEQTFAAENLGAAAARRLAVSPGTAALRIERRYIGTDGRALALAVSIHPAGRFAYPSVLERDPGPGR
ncbi:MAG: GntR family transcriptional regulator [Pseudomonadota bacterium]|jgi:GntR family transcriptional regulator